MPLHLAQRVITKQNIKESEKIDMQINVSNGNKLIVVKKTPFLNVDDIVRVTNVDEEMGVISFVFGDNFSECGVMSFGKCEEYFEKLVDEVHKAPKVTEERIEEILEDAEIESYTVFDKCTVVACKLPNGFVIVESSACVSPENYDETLGFEICLEKIENKIWELEGYRLQEELYQQSLAEECPYDCDNCLCNACEEDDCHEDHDVDVEVDFDVNVEVECEGCEECGYCKEYDCPNNLMS